MCEGNCHQLVCSLEEEDENVSDKEARAAQAVEVYTLKQGIGCFSVGRFDRGE